MVSQLYTSYMVKESINTAIKWPFTLRKTSSLPEYMDGGRVAVVSYCEVAEGGLSHIECKVLDGDECDSEHRSCSPGAGRCMCTFCASYISIQQSTASAFTWCL